MRCATYILLALALGRGAPVSAQSNIDPDHKFAWAENVGWTNWRDADSAVQGVIVTDAFLSGYIWAENVGYINVGDGPFDAETYANIDDTDFGVNVDTDTGELFGYGWAENVGWINFDTSATSDPTGEICQGGNCAARFDVLNGRFRGYAWGENVGWINLDDGTHFVATPAEMDIPTVSEWGMVAMMLLVLTAGTVVLFRRRRWAA